MRGYSTLALVTAGRRLINSMVWEGTCIKHAKCSTGVSIRHKLHWHQPPQHASCRDGNCFSWCKNQQLRHTPDCLAGLEGVALTAHIKCHHNDHLQILDSVERRVHLELDQACIPHYCFCVIEEGQIQLACIQRCRVVDPQHADGPPAPQQSSGAWRA